MQTKLLMSFIAIGIAGLMMGAGTFAYFSNTATSTQNTFTAGTLDIELANTGDSFPNNPNNDNGDNAKATWVSPAGWAPGEEVTATLRFTNPGSVDIKSMSLDFNVVSRNGNGDGSELDEMIIITSWKEHFKDTETWTGWETFYDMNKLKNTLGLDSDDDGNLTLAELDGITDFLGSGAPGPVTQDDQSGDGVILKGGNHQDYKLELTFKFNESAGNLYQGDSCELEIVFDGHQNFPWFGDETGT